MKIFIDVDNTILEHSHFYSKNTESRTHKIISNNLKANKDAIKTMYESALTSIRPDFKKYWERDNFYILTKYPTLEFDKYKQIKLAQVLSISREELMNATDKNGIKKYLNIPLETSKVDYVRSLFKVKDISNYILIDDYSQNIIQWEAEGGIGIKFFNEYNNPNHPAIGISISNFKLLDLILSEKQINKLYFQSQNPLISEMLISNILKSENVEKKINDELQIPKVVDITNIIYLDAIKKLNLKGKVSHLKYNYLNFVKEYYGLMSEFENEYWIKKFNSYCKTKSFLILKSSLEINIDSILTKNDIADNDYLTIKVLNDEKEIKNDYNIFITINENKYYVDNYIYQEKIKNIFKILFKGINGEQ